MEEKVVNVPLKSDTKDWLLSRAKSNGRSMGREAQKIIESVHARSENRK